MLQEIQLQMLPGQFASTAEIKRLLRLELKLKSETPLEFRVLRKSIDARGRAIKIQAKFQVAFQGESLPTLDISFQQQQVTNSHEVHIIGAGPAGLFAALRCIELGLRPIVIERGKEVRARRRDLAALNKEGILNEESNYCFGEGGAGTYSDGKLYTRSNKRGNMQRILELFHFFGADDSILYEAHPHIGTNKLPQIIESMREAIRSCGGEVHFETKLADIYTDSEKITAIQLNGNTRVEVHQIILATGHSASDIYELLHQRNISIEAKPFALGVRVEHPQSLIDEIQYHGLNRGNVLPPASFSLVEQVNERGVFSFCMCPGGIIAPAATHQGAVVVNGWSPSKRNNPFANSGMVVSVGPEDYPDTSALGGFRFQRAVEQKAFEAGGGLFKAPAQRLTDFILHRHSSSLPICSYHPGVTSTQLNDVLPRAIHDCLTQGFTAFGKKMRGFITEEAIVVATESRTSSPVKIPRDKETLQHIQFQNLYPCAEGAGYAGGIVSAAMDGMRIVEKIATLVS